MGKKQGRAMHGQVTVNMGDGNSILLKPTLEAMDAIHRRWPEGIQQCMMALQKQNPRDCAYVIQYGAGYSKAEAKDLANDVFQAGTAHIAVQLMDFLLALMNPTGKEDSDFEEQDQGE